MAHDHYKKDVRHLDMIDVYRVLALWNVTDPCIQHAVKKLLVAGGRGAGKSFLKDIQEAIDSLERCKDMLAEDAGKTRIESETVMIDEPDKGFRGVIEYHPSGPLSFRIFHGSHYRLRTQFTFDEHGRYTGYNGHSCPEDICEWVYMRASAIFDSRVPAIVRSMEPAESVNARDARLRTAMEEMSK
ncbi:hypothetical protein PQD73_gp027 [Stenotrophomonas phage Salva]|uniref:Uncharacterized protein n=1 Tax=Stenotrophomonas phage Salva TaxID=2801524 RepID=A0A7U3WJV8_9CAUD|nr:hypothetical protein PQD73_gp027 [Stenotrophomonas phage Salva]QQM18191.1 hypothetical protein CPT_Salva_027 [Stenotrophomonas phage Salva]